VLPRASRSLDEEDEGSADAVAAAYVDGMARPAWQRQWSVGSDNNAAWGFARPSTVDQPRSLPLRLEAGALPAATAFGVLPTGGRAMTARERSFRGPAQRAASVRPRASAEGQASRAPFSPEYPHGVHGGPLGETAAEPRKASLARLPTKLRRFQSYDVAVGAGALSGWGASTARAPAPAAAARFPLSDFPEPEPERLMRRVAAGAGHLFEPREPEPSQGGPKLQQVEGAAQGAAKTRTTRFRSDGAQPVPAAAAAAAGRGYPEPERLMRRVAASVSPVMADHGRTALGLRSDALGGDQLPGRRAFAGASDFMPRLGSKPTPARMAPLPPDGARRGSPTIDEARTFLQPERIYRPVARRPDTQPKAAADRN
jgi:hypothetical protein